MSVNNSQVYSPVSVKLERIRSLDFRNKIVGAVLRVAKMECKQQSGTTSKIRTQLLVLLIGLLQELPDEQLDVGDVAAHLIDVVVLFCLFEVEPVHAARAHVLLAYDACTHINVVLKTLLNNEWNVNVASYISI